MYCGEAARTKWASQYQQEKDKEEVDNRIVRIQENY